MSVPLFSLQFDEATLQARNFPCEPPPDGTKIKITQIDGDGVSGGTGLNFDLVPTDPNTAAAWPVLSRLGVREFPGHCGSVMLHGIYSCRQKKGYSGYLHRVVLDYLTYKHTNVFATTTSDQTGENHILEKLGFKRPSWLWSKKTNVEVTLWLKRLHKRPRS